MEEIKVIFKRPISKERKEDAYKKMIEFNRLSEKVLKKIESNQDDNFDYIVLLDLMLQAERFAKMFGFDSAEDMQKFIKYFGTEKLIECD